MVITHHKPVQHAGSEKADTTEFSLAVIIAKSKIAHPSLWLFPLDPHRDSVIQAK